MPTYRRVLRRPQETPQVADLRRLPGNGESAESEPAEDLSTLKKDELVALADERGIDSSGTKADIIGRLEA